MTILPVELLVQAGQVAHPDGLHPSLWFLNLNRPADLLLAESSLAGLSSGNLIYSDAGRIS